MTDRYDALVIVLDGDVRSDDAKTLIEAIGLLRGVVSVEPHVRQIEQCIGEARIRRDLENRLWAALRREVTFKELP
jgi:hypothetical protein